MGYKPPLLTMKYKSIDEIKKDFGISSSDISEIKTELREILKEIHPDKNGEKFKNKLDEVNYHKILSAFEFFEQEFAFVAKAELTALTAIIKDSSSPLKEQKQIEVLDKKIDSILQKYKDSIRTPKISSAVISVVFTFLWLFPSTIKDHPILSRFISSGSVAFTVIWFYSVCITGGYWLLAKRRELRIEEATKKLGLEFIQNRLFNLFIKTRAETKETNNVGFTKDQLITFLTELDFFSLTLNPDHRQHFNPFEILLLIKRVDRNISLDVAQSLADIIIERAKKKNFLQLKADNNLVDTFELG